MFLLYPETRLRRQQYVRLDWSRLELQTLVIRCHDDGECSRCSTKDHNEPSRVRPRNEPLDIKFARHLIGRVSLERFNRGIPGCTYSVTVCRSSRGWNWSAPLFPRGASFVVDVVKDFKKEAWGKRWEDVVCNFCRPVPPSRSPC